LLLGFSAMAMRATAADKYLVSFGPIFFPNRSVVVFNKLLLAATLVLSLSAPAFAFTDARVNVPDGAFSLTCHPLAGPYRSDRDPTVRIVISMDLDASNDWAARTFEVVHHLWSGQIINRDDQYVGGISKDRGVAQWHWDGVLQRNRSVSMRGTLYKNDVVGWRYREILFKQGRVEQVLPELDCALPGD
jgi:hypothetical protein